jgi:hypothetical protein
VAKLQLSRTNFDQSIPSATQAQALKFCPFSGLFIGFNNGLYRFRALLCKIFFNAQYTIAIKYLQHPDGKTALERGQVDAWAGLDPLMASAQIQSGS